MLQSQGGQCGFQYYRLQFSFTFTDTWNTQKKNSDRKRPKEGERVALHHFHERVDESPRQDENFEPSGAPVAFFVSEIWPFEVDFSARSNST